MTANCGVRFAWPTFWHLPTARPGFPRELFGTVTELKSVATLDQFERNKAVIDVEAGEN